MSLLKHAPSLQVADAQRLVLELYGIDGTATPLVSERDQNFRIETPDASFVFKVANGLEDRGSLEAQNAAMAHVAAATGLSPRALPARSGESIQTVDGHLLRLLTWTEGITLGSMRHHSTPLLRDLGRAVGRMGTALETFDHPAAHRAFDWDLARAAAVIGEHASLITERDARGLVESIAEQQGAAVASVLAALPRSVIHNDANDHNVIVRGTDRVDARDQRVGGIIDFGDMVHSVTVADLAVAMAYAALGTRDPLQSAAEVATGYFGVRALTPAERDALWPLVLLRLALSICMAARQVRESPDNDYLRVSQPAISRTLSRLLDPKAARAALDAAHDTAMAVRRRRRATGRNLTLAYDQPVRLVRGSMQYVFDTSGRRYLDAFNNVPHVGHAHPRVAEAATAQVRLLNTNTRYLHDSLAAFADRLTATLPAPLRVCYFLNSGSEANELALRLARTHTQRRDVVVLEAAYHGHTTTLIDISPYKFNGPGGAGQPAWVHVVPVPDVYRGRFGADDPSAGEHYAGFVADVIEGMRESGRGPGAFIAETCPSVAGQIVFPRGYLAAVYRHVREAGGICIADEVQTAYGRMGSSFYAFEDQAVVPDIVVLGKPIGNGYPLAAVVTTAEIAASFDNGMEFFSTFGGSTVSCAVGLAVLDVVQSLELQRHAARVGAHLSERLRALAARFPWCGDVRGGGLFLGIELVRDRRTLDPAPMAAAYVVNRMREDGVLIGTDGPMHNVLKIRPPMPFNVKDAETLVGALERALGEIEA